MQYNRLNGFGYADTGVGTPVSEQLNLSERCQGLIQDFDIDSCSASVADDVRRVEVAKQHGGCAGCNGGHLA